MSTSSPSVPPGATRSTCSTPAATPAGGMRTPPAGRLRGRPHNNHKPPPCCARRRQLKQLLPAGDGGAPSHSERPTVGAADGAAAHDLGRLGHAPPPSGPRGGQSSSGTRGAAVVAEQTNAGAGAAAGRRRPPPNLKPLQIPAGGTTTKTAGDDNNNADGQRLLAPVFAMPTAANGGARVRKRAATSKQDKETRKPRQTKPMYVCCQLLASVQVEKLLLPAIADRVETWTRSFSFKPAEAQMREEIKRLSLVVITCTTLLQKSTSSPPPQGPEAWWRKYTFAPVNNSNNKKEQQVIMARLTEDELAFLEMEPLLCSLTDLVTGNVSLVEAVSMSPGNSPPAGEPQPGAGAMMQLIFPFLVV